MVLKSFKKRELKENFQTPKNSSTSETPLFLSKQILKSAMRKYRKSTSKATNILRLSVSIHQQPNRLRTCAIRNLARCCPKASEHQMEGCHLSFSSEKKSFKLQVSIILSSTQHRQNTENYISKTLPLMKTCPNRSTSPE